MWKSNSEVGSANSMDEASSAENNLPWSDVQTDRKIVDSSQWWCSILNECVAIHAKAVQNQVLT